MGSGLVYATLRFGYAWILLNLAAIAFFSALFTAEEVRHAFQSRRLTRSHRRAAVVPIQSR